MEWDKPSTADSALADFGNDPELLRDFVVEAREHLSEIEMHLLVLDQDAGNKEALHAIFRGFHTIKGVAGFLGLSQLEELAHEVETLLDLARNGHLLMKPAHIDLVLNSADYLSRRISEIDRFLNTGERPAAVSNSELIAAVRAALAPKIQEEMNHSVAEMILEYGDKVSADLVGLSVSVANVSSPRPETVKDKALSAEASHGAANATNAIKVDTCKLDYLIDMVGEMVIAQSLVRHDPDLELNSTTRLSRNIAQLTRMTSELQRAAMSMRMVQISQVFRKMNRLVRDLCRQTGKQVELELRGEETELDRNLVEQLGDAVMHMVRNAVDHGIERPEQRMKAGKTAAGHIVLKAAHQGSHIVVEVSDDGRGLDVEAIRQKAREKGLIARDAELPDAEAFQLIFHPGFSTAQQVTAVSGRGVGMDVVQRQIEKLRGKIEIRSAPGQGTTFVLKLPITLAIIDGLVVGVGAERYIVPLFAVREILRPTPDMISTVQGKNEMALVRGALIPIVRLHSRFRVRSQSEDLCSGVLIVTESQRNHFCLFVNQLIGKQEVVIKSLGQTFRHIRGLAGGAILGDGRVGLILDPDTLFSEAA